MNSLTVSRVSPVDNDLVIEEYAVGLENVFVGYRVPNKHTRSFKEYVIYWMKGEIKHRTFLALQGVNMNIRRGEVFGLVGHNGAGKSTLLKLIARVLKPTNGRVWVKGRVAPLLGIGAGFHPELTGRENVFLNGAILGLTRQEIEAKFDSIIDFAGLWDFVDAPMRTYSSGMWARLGFAVATAVEPEVLVIDEVLAVGDESFKQKSSERIREFCDQGVTVLIASHSLDTVENMCNRIAWLDHGQVRLIGEPQGVIRAYRQSQK